MSVLTEDDVDKLVDAVSDRLTSDISETLADEFVDDLPPRIVQELRDEELNSLSPAEGIDRFREYKQEKVAESTMERYHTKLDYIETFLTDVLEVDDLTDLTPEQTTQFENWRREESTGGDPLAPKTVKDDMHLYQGFLERMVKLNAVPADAYEIVEIPELDTGDGVDKTTLDPTRADNILTYLERFEYATLPHVTNLLLIKVGRRGCDIRAPDVSDYTPVEESSGEGATLAFKHRPETGTPLKENEKHEAEIELQPESAQIIEDFLEYHRPDVVDEYGRKPLLATDNGRIGKSTIRDHAYKWTSPCASGRSLPENVEEYLPDGEHDHNPATCPASSNVKDASKCSLSRPPKDIRSGYITAKLNAGASYEAVGYRVGATKRVLKKHYDHPDLDEERARHRDEIKDASRQESGYAN